MMMKEDADSILDALDRIKDWAMEKMLASGEAPDGDAGDAPPGDMPPPSEEPAGELEIEVSAAPEFEGEPKDEDEGEKTSVLRRYDFAGAKPPKKFPSKVPVSRR